MEQRVELNLHTRASADSSIITPRMALNIVSAMGQKAVAITDLDSVQSFHSVSYAKKTCAPQVKVIYGAEAKDSSGTYTILVKDQEGLKTLYQKLSGKEITPRQRQHLLIGSSHHQGELYRAVAEQATPEKLREIADRYDYIELFVGSDADDHREINKHLYALGKELEKPVVAVGGCHYAFPEEKICKTILDSRYNRPIHTNQESSHMRTTEEMLHAFSYLGEEAAYEVVVANTNALADSIEEIDIAFSAISKFSSPEAEEMVTCVCREKLESLYGKQPPEAIKNRLEEELLSIENNAGVYSIVYRLAKHMQKMGVPISTRGTIGSMLIAYLLGISQVNPLPAHYRCPKCQHTEFAEADSGYDLPDKICPHCKAVMKGDGHNIPYETCTRFAKGECLFLDINVPQFMQTEAISYVAESLGKERVAYTGTVSTYMERGADVLVRSYRQSAGVSTLFETEHATLVKKLCGVKINNGMFLYGLLLLPEGMEWEDVTPVRYLDTPVCGIDKVTHKEYFDILEVLPKLNILGYPVLDRVGKMFAITGVKPEDINYNDPKIYDLIGNLDTKGIPEFSSQFCLEIIASLPEVNFSNLLRISGMAHGTNVWTDNAEYLLCKDYPFQKLISTRDDIFLTLMGYGVDKKTAFEVMEAVRKGKFGGDNEKNRQLTKQLQASGVPEWYIWSMKQIHYLFPKAHAAHYTKLAITAAWFKCYYPEAFYIASLQHMGAEAYLQESSETLERLLHEMPNDRENSREIEKICLILEARDRGIALNW